MKNKIKLLIMAGSIVFLTGCSTSNHRFNLFAYKQVDPKVVTVDEVVNQYDLPQVHVNHNGTRYVNVKAKDYAKNIVAQRQLEENAIAAEKSKIYSVNNQLANGFLFKK